MSYYRLPIVLTGLCLALLHGCGGSKQDQQEKSKQDPQQHPNVLFISVDDLRPTLGVYGDEQAVTPNIDRFAMEEALTFTNTYCQAAVCAPSRASLMTGLRPDSTKVWHLGDEFRETIPNVVTMPQHFDKFGYHTVSMGKIFHNYMPDSISWDEPDLKPERYQKYEGRDAETFYHTKQSKRRQRKRRKALLENNPDYSYANGWNCGPAFEAADKPDSIYYDAAQTDLAIRKMKALQDEKEPFYMAIGYYRPHLPYVVPQKYWDLYNRDSFKIRNNSLPEGAPAMAANSNYELRGYLDYRSVNRPSGSPLPADSARMLKHGYYASVSFIDACLGRLFKTLEQTGLDQNTIVVIWGDHGYKLGEHRGWGKQTNFEIDNHVPLMISTPEMRNKGEKSDALTELVDLYPTLCDLAGIKVPDYLQGTSLQPLIKKPERPWKDAVFHQFRRRAGISANGKAYMGYAMRTLRYHYIEWHSWNPETHTAGEAIKAVELYDLQKDPQETVNLAEKAGNQALIDRLSAKMDSGWRSARPPIN